MSTVETTPGPPSAGPPSESGPLPPPLPPRGRRWPAVLAAIVVVSLVSGGLGLVWARHRISPGGPGGAEVQVAIPLGTSTAGIASLLGRTKVIESPSLFRLYIRLKGAGPFEAGDYTFHLHSGYAAALGVLRAGPEVTYSKITIPEGFTLAQIAARVGKLPGRSAARFLAAASSGAVQSRFQPPGSTDLEGLLYPATYPVGPNDDEASLLRRMVATFDDTAASLGIDQAAARLAISPYQVVTVASMVEREAKLDEDRGPIASVIYNRLQRGMPLGIDATLLYGLQTSQLSQKDLASDNPYNTRKNRGLPPTPIASPGTPSLMAAISPPATPYLYYVLIDKNGKTAFATTAAEFEQLKAQAKAQGLLGN
jgi:peptidoglycan lytic transglycosylase G